MLKTDFHIHSIHSGHAYGTFYDIVREAKRKHMKIIAISDHGPAMKGSASNLHFGMRSRIPENLGIKVLWGCEANILDGNGAIDLDDYLLKRLDLIMVGLHHNCGYKDLGIKGNTEAVKKALKNPRIKILVHPTHMQYPVDFEEIVKTALDNDVLLELNLSMLIKNGEKDFALFKKMIDMAKARKKMIIIGSDAHFVEEIGDDSVLKKYKKKLGLSDDMIINNHPKELMRFLGLPI